MIAGFFVAFFGSGFGAYSKAGFLIFAGFAAVLTFLNNVKIDSILDRIEGGVSDVKKGFQKELKVVRKENRSKDKQLRLLEEQRTLMRKLVGEGLIKEQRILEIIDRDRFMYLFCYQNFPDQNEIVSPLLGAKESRNPTLVAVESLGFIKVGKMSNYYVIPLSSLEPKMRTPEAVTEEVVRRLKPHWKSLLEKIKQADEQKYREYTAKHPNAMNGTFLVGQSTFHDICVEYVGYNAFSAAFKEMLSDAVDLDKLKKELSRHKHEVRKFVLSMSIDVLLSGIKTKKDRELIIENEEVLQKELDARNLTDFAGITDALASELEAIGLSAAKSAKYAKQIETKSQKFGELFDSLGITV